MKLTPYPEYKDSGVPWLGKIPAHWDAKPLKHWVYINQTVLGEDTPPNFEFNYIDISAVADGILVKQPKKMQFCNSPSRARRVIKDGDTLLSTVRTYLKAIYHFAGKKERHIASTGFAVISPKETDHPSFIAYLTQSNPFISQICSNSAGVAYPAISESVLGVCKCWIPTKFEQAQIARFLDWKISRINKFIRNKKRLIELLKEQKQVIINRAVTRGLNPDAKLKPSGIDWLGDIPEHWNIIKIKRVAKSNPSKTEVNVKKIKNKMVVFLPMEKIPTDGDISHYDKRMLAEVWSGFTYFKQGDIIIAKITPCFENGKGAYLEKLDTEFGFGTTELIALRPSNKIKGAFLRLITSSSMFIKEGEHHMTGAAGQKRITLDFVSNFQIALPPVNEQIQILETIKEKNLRLNGTIARAEREIALITEYKERLISDVVTCKVDVRKVKVPEISDDDLLPPYDEDKE